MKLVRILIIALGLMTIATVGAFAAVPFFTSSTVNEMAVNAQTGLAGTIQMTAINTGTASLNEIINITFGGAQISSLSNFSVSISAATGGVSHFGTANPNLYNTDFPLNAAGSTFPVGEEPIVRVTNGTISIRFPVATTFNVPAAPAAAEGIQISGVRLNVASVGVVGGQVFASISSVLGSVTVTNPALAVATLREPITILAAPVAPAPGFNLQVASFSTAGTPITNPAIVNVQELFTNAFETMGAGVGAATQVILRISNIPAGLAVSSITSSFAGSAGVTLGVPTFGTPSGGQVTITIPITAQNSSTIDTVTANLSFSATPGATIPIGTATVAATLGPAASATALNEIAANTNDPGVSPIPVDATHPLRYAQRFVPSPEVNVLVITQLTTQLLAVFNSWVPGSFDTGFAIANTSGFNTGFGNVTGQAGTVTAILYPSDGSASKTVTTSATVFGGTGGLDASGQIPAHGSWTFLLSDLAKQAGFATGFTGQVFFQVNASNCHGINYISDATFQKLAQGYSMLVLPVSRTAAFDSLSF